MVTITLVDAAGKPIVGYRADDNQGIVGSLTLSVSDAPVSVDLTPTTEISPPSYWQAKVHLSGRTLSSAKVQLAAGDALTLPEFLALDEAPDWWDVNENRLLPDPTGAIDGSIPTVASGTWVIGNVLSGGNPYVAPPASQAASGTQGMRAWDGIFFYECVATDTWIRYVPQRAWS
jgi:hypothetical protein